MGSGKRLDFILNVAADAGRCASRQAGRSVSHCRIGSNAAISDAAMPPTTGLKELLEID